VTGASRVIARWMAWERARTVLTARNELNLHRTADTICPGSTKGPHIHRICDDLARAENISVEDVEAAFTAPAALKRFVKPETHAAVCVFLASKEGRDINRQDINVSGDLTWYYRF
jgi:NAD(P)-dependent dehydrogenase (short-subunit alcohol dehydrogenase family)